MPSHTPKSGCYWHLRCQRQQSAAEPAVCLSICLSVCTNLACLVHINPTILAIRNKNYESYLVSPRLASPRRLSPHKWISYASLSAWICQAHQKILCALRLANYKDIVNRLKQQQQKKQLKKLLMATRLHKSCESYLIRLMCFYKTFRSFSCLCKLNKWVKKALNALKAKNEFKSCIKLNIVFNVILFFIITIISNIYLLNRKNVLLQLLNTFIYAL